MRVLKSARHGTGGGNYYLDTDYNDTRMAELERVDLVINCWTTFAFDAALAGKPVMQLRRQPSIETESHIKKDQHSLTARDSPHFDASEPATKPE